jgi:hypothetical protein
MEEIYHKVSCAIKSFHSRHCAGSTKRVFFKLGLGKKDCQMVEFKGQSPFFHVEITKLTFLFCKSTNIIILALMFIKTDKE